MARPMNSSVAVLKPHGCQPARRRCWRVITSTPAADTMTRASSSVHTGEVCAKMNLRTSAISASCTTMRNAAMASGRSSRSVNSHDTAALTSSRDAASARSSGDRGT